MNSQTENQVAKVSNSVEAMALFCLFLSNDYEFDVQGIYHLMTHVLSSTIVMETFLYLLNAINLLKEKNL